MSSKQVEPELEPRNAYGEPFFPDTVLMVACDQCSKAMPWPLSCGHTYVTIYKQEYTRVPVDSTAPRAAEHPLPQTDYRNKQQLDDKQRYRFGHLFHEYTFNNCDHGEETKRVCFECVVECLYYSAQRAAAPPAPKEEEWQPIKTAPKDSSWILALMRTRRQAVIRWRGGAWEDDNRLCRDPIRWMPLPPAPVVSDCDPDA